ncbi:Bug family tripartite tricarboxylate transporter substrate binding protein [Achromobacter aloeverae]|uniref:Tripartite tricarboxylate transporter substrate binding protein n=1 Tax=Achromobacter aloeverae TaxID=1750518 RepID=A0A4Q1HLU1_9BURK|nr:tripartite tricarboxylate transporter substrate binding protein [Achromobacter aloeverae]RXN91328.1 tripartite tricarboxylate transporter substrate binding protein [Achromobacter aloeverae]
MKKVLAATAAAFAALLSCVASTAHADTYPSKPIRLVVPLAPGGSADVLGRLIAQKLSEKYGQSVIVENRPGVGGNIGAENVARSEPDGYSLLFGTIGIHSTYKIYTNLKYDPTQDLKPVVLLAEMPNVLVVPKNSQLSDTRAVIAEGKAHPNTLFFGSAGFGSSTHMAGELFKYQSHADISHIPYKGSGPALTDLVGGRLQLMFENLPTALPLIKSGQLRALAVTSATRTPSLPDVPTIAEDGLPGYAFTAWFTIAAPAHTPDAIVAKLNRDIRDIMLSKDMAPKLADLGVTPVPGNRDAQATATFIAGETRTFSQMIQAAHLTAR